jgi:hypothetical protein
LHPAASACCCSGIVTIVTATTPSNPSAATMAIIVIEVVIFLPLSGGSFCNKLTKNASFIYFYIEIPLNSYLL